MIRKEKLIWLRRQAKEAVWTFVLVSTLVSLNTLLLSSIKMGKLEREASIFLILGKGLIRSLNELGLLGQKEQIKIGMEATGRYMKCPVRCLISDGYRVQIYNPNLIARFRESEAVNLAKTDNLDAMLIANYVATHPFTSSPQLSYLIGEVRKISRAKYFLFGDKTACYSHLLRYLGEVFPEFVSFFKKNEDGSRKNTGRNLFESPTIGWLLSNYPSASKMAKMRVETGEALRRMSKGSISFNRFNQLRELAKKFDRPFYGSRRTNR